MLQRELRRKQIDEKGQERKEKDKDRKRESRIKETKEEEKNKCSLVLPKYSKYTWRS